MLENTSNPLRAPACGIEFSEKAGGGERVGRGYAFSDRFLSANPSQGLGNAEVYPYPFFKPWDKFFHLIAQGESEVNDIKLPVAINSWHIFYAERADFVFQRASEYKTHD